jgi:hypothetical protein
LGHDQRLRRLAAQQVALVGRDIFCRTWALRGPRKLEGGRRRVKAKGEREERGQERRDTENPK